MSKERYCLFSNGTEFMQWQARNCEKCIKAVFYDEKKDRWPKYRCAVQKHIEEAAITDGRGNKRDYEATRSDCPYKKDLNQLIKRTNETSNQSRRQLPVFPIPMFWYIGCEGDDGTWYAEGGEE